MKKSISLMTAAVLLRQFTAMPVLSQEPLVNDDQHNGASFLTSMKIDLRNDNNFSEAPPSRKDLFLKAWDSKEALHKIYVESSNEVDQLIARKRWEDLQDLEKSRAEEADEWDLNKFKQLIALKKTYITNADTFASVLEGFEQMVMITKMQKLLEKEASLSDNYVLLREIHKRLDSYRKDSELNEIIEVLKALYLKNAEGAPENVVEKMNIQERSFETKVQIAAIVGSVLALGIIGPQMPRLLKYLRDIINAWRTPQVDEGVSTQPPAKRERKPKKPSSAPVMPMGDMGGGSTGATLLRAPATTLDDQLADLARQRLQQAQVVAEEEDATGEVAAANPQVSILHAIQPQLPQNLMKPGAARKVLRLIKQRTQDADEIKAAFLTIYVTIGKVEAADLFEETKADL